MDPGSLNEFMGKYSFTIPSAILMAAGSVVMLTGFCGCLGAIRESRCLLGSVSCQLHRTKGGLGINCIIFLFFDILLLFYLF